MSVFRFKYFDVIQEKNALKVGTDSMLLGSFINSTNRKYGLDLGSGTGVLSLMVAQKNPEIQIDAIELDFEGAKECQDNFQNSSFRHRLNSECGNYFDFQFKRKYDLIFSNPPYYLDSLPSKVQSTNDAKHSNVESCALLFELIYKTISKDGTFWLIVPFANRETILEIAEQNLFFPKEIIQIHSKSSIPDVRIIFCFHLSKTIPIIRNFIIRDENGSYSKAYRELTSDYHWDLF